MIVQFKMSGLMNFPCCFFPTSNENEGQMKNYATDTMNELLGMFGFDKVDQDETDQLKLGDKFSAKAGRCDKVLTFHQLNHKKMVSSADDRWTFSNFFQKFSKFLFSSPFGRIHVNINS